MNQEQWIFFNEFKSSFKQKINEWNIFNDELMDLQKKTAQNANNVLYSFETPIVYNRDLDKITQEDEIKLIVIGDNPGKDEQLQKNNRYLVGQAGKLADSFFKKNPTLNIDFRKNVIILNKTPVHSAKTNCTYQNNHSRTCNRHTCASYPPISYHMKCGNIKNTNNS